ncbi:MAG: nicotinamide-nucleotide amidohydrolase family protein, partial [Kiloniellales bacterium]
MFDKHLLAQAETLLDLYRRANLRIATAESCTGGLIAGLLTEIPGSSDVLERGFVAYSNQAKSDLLGVPAKLIQAHGAVSAEVAQAMAAGALDNSPA